MPASAEQCRAVPADSERHKAQASKAKHAYGKRPRPWMDSRRGLLVYEELLGFHLKSTRRSSSFWPSATKPTCAKPGFHSKVSVFLPLLYKPRARQLWLSCPGALVASVHPLCSDLNGSTKH